MNKLMGVVVGVNLAVACLMVQGCKAPKAGADRPARAQKVEQPAPVAEPSPAPAPAAEPVPAPEPVAEVKPLPPPAPVAEAKPSPTPEAAPVSEVASAAETTEYVVKSGDVLSKICRRAGVKQSEVLKLNPGLNPNRIRLGQKIKLPGKVTVAAPEKAAKSSAKPAAANVKAPAATKQAFKSYVGPTKEYVVVNGDSVGKIAYGNGISIRALKELNGLKSNNLRVGQKLKVPAEKQVAAKESAKAAKPAADKKEVKAPEAAAPAKAEESKTDAPKAETKPEAAAAQPAAPVESAPAAAAPAESAAPAPAPAEAAAPAPAVSALTHVVKSGEDLVSIAIRYGTSLMELKELNGLAGEEVKPGQELKLPAGVKAK